MNIKSIILITCVFFISCVPSKNLVTSVEEFNRAVKSAVAGDTIRLAKGTWNDVCLIFEGRGSAEQPIVLTAETAGQVVFSGASSLKIAGEYLEVNGLVFKNGYTPDKSVITFRKDKNHVANNSRLTNCVIDFYSPPDRFRQDDWVVLYGRNNRVDHCFIGGKMNAGVSLVVRLDDEKNQQNYHSIDHNHFGYRPRMGSNGGETIRVGVSTFSLASSNTIIEKNYFEHCNGETEVVSIKSSDNIVRGNVFYECEGSLVLRHGNRNLLENNFFLGNNKPHTGGIRVINAGHIIRKNHLQELKGERFRAALAIMNGVPNSLLNRYHQVNDVMIENNVFIRCENIEFGAGSDNERTATPQNTVLKQNIFYYPGSKTMFKILDDMSGVSFIDNRMDPPNENIPDPVAALFTQEKNGLWQSVNYTPQLPVQKSDVGVPWYTAQTLDVVYSNSGKIHHVTPEEPDALLHAVKNSAAGDIIELVESGSYFISETINIVHPLWIRASKNLKTRPLLLAQSIDGVDAFITIQNGGSLKINGFAFYGESENGIVSIGISSSSRPMLLHYKVEADNCEFYNFNASRYNAFRSYASTFADSITFRNCIFRNISGTAINLASEKEDEGKYSVEYLTVENCLFLDVMGSAVDLYRGGNDESTFGPFLYMNHCSFITVNNKELGSVLRLIGVQNALVENCLFVESGKSGRVILLEDPRWANIRIDYINLYNSGRLESYYTDRFGRNITRIRPQFNTHQNNNFLISDESPLSTAGNDKKAIGFLGNK